MRSYEESPNLFARILKLTFYNTLYKIIDFNKRYYQIFPFLGQEQYVWFNYFTIYALVKKDHTILQIFLPTMFQHLS